MSQRFRAISSSLPHHQRPFNYLQNSPLRKQKQFKQINRPKRFVTQEQQRQFQLLVEFQLRRQKQKVIILQQRLKNKQSFIKQMKEFQDQLTQTFQKCQQDLLWHKKQCITYENLLKQKQQQIVLLKKMNQQEKIVYDTFCKVNEGNIIGVNQNREYLQQIAQLKHLVIRLEQEINFYQKRQKQFNKNHINSAQKQFYPENQYEHLKTEKTEKYYSKIDYMKNSQKKRSKTLANQFNQKQDQNFSKIQIIQKEFIKEKQKIASFINHFLTMVEFMNPDLARQHNFKNKLKKGWKWIKNVVVEWNHLKKQNMEKIKEYKLGNFVMKFLPFNIKTFEAEKILESLLTRK